MPCPRFWLEGEPGLAEESIAEIGLLLDPVQLVSHRGGELVCGAGLDYWIWPGRTFLAGIITD
jgi:hypothetical protein